MTAGEADVLKRRGSTGRRWRLVPAVAVYGVLALLAYLPVYPGDPHRLPTCACGDPALQVWALRWTPFAIAHGHNVFFTNWIDYPGGANLAQNTLMPLLGILAAPMTLWLGPIASLNALLWLALVASSTSCFLVLRRWVSWSPAAFLGGLLYGFSPYIAGQATGHLFLTFVPLPPLIFLALDQLIVRQAGSARRWGLGLGLLAAAQYLISPEVFFSTVLLATFGVVLLAVFRSGEVARRAPHVLRALGWALLVAVPLTAFPLAFALFGPERFVGSAHGSYPSPSDLLGLVVPTSDQLLAPSGLASVGDRFVLGNIVENDTYLGIPLLAVVAWLSLRCRRFGIVRWAAAMAATAWVFSLGPQLVVDAHQTTVPLPFDLLYHLPFVSSLIDSRLSLYTDLFVAVLLAVGIDHLHADLRRRRWRPAERWGLVTLIAAIAVVPLVPRWPYPSFPASVPHFFSSSEATRIPDGGVVLAYPYPDGAEIQAMMWDADTSMRFRLLGGYALIPNSQKLATLNPFPVEPAIVPATLEGDFTGQHPGATATARDVRSLLRTYHVSTVISSWSGSDPGQADALFASALGVAPEHVGGVDVWFDVPRDLGSGS